jgi:twitching motility protein PilU
MAPGSQTFEQSLFKLFVEGSITQDEAMLNADSATNMLWLINQATAGQITSGQVSVPVKPLSGQKGDNPQDGPLAGNSASFDGIKIDTTT